MFSLPSEQLHAIYGKAFLYGKAHKRQKRNRICPEPPIPRHLNSRNQIPFPIVNIPEVSEKANPDVPTFPSLPSLNPVNSSWCTTLPT